MFMFYFTLTELWAVSFEQMEKFSVGVTIDIALYQWQWQMAMCYIRMISHKFIWIREIEKAKVRFEIWTWRLPNEAKNSKKKSQAAKRTRKRYVNKK